MICECGGKYAVVDSYTEDKTTYRRRKCGDCGHVMYTTENEDMSNRTKSMLTKKRRLCQ